MGSAATLNVGLSEGNVLRVGDLGIGIGKDVIPTRHGGSFIADSRGLADNPWAPANGAGIQFSYANQRTGQIWITAQGRIYYRWNQDVDPAVAKNAVPWIDIYSNANTTKGSDGTLKAASPVARIAGKDTSTRPDIDEDSFEWCGYGVANSEAHGIEIIRDDIGVYRVTGAKSLASSGWRLLPPRDPDGSGDLGVVTAEQRDDEIIITLFRRKMVLADGEIVIQPGEPIDVPANSWIDIRLDMPESAIPPETEPE